MHMVNSLYQTLHGVSKYQVPMLHTTNMTLTCQLRKNYTCYHLTNHALFKAPLESKAL